LQGLRAPLQGPGGGGKYDKAGKVGAMLSAARRLLRRLVPVPLRQAVALARRGLTGRGLAYAQLALPEVAADWQTVCTVEQPIKQSRLWEGKLHNLQIGAAMVSNVIIAPGEVLSLWALLSRPTAARGFALGRAIREDAETGDVGGGLCQLSGLIYELGLRAGLEVIERHPHSRDLYECEEDRFTPLGLDATIVWPWKDLRLRNGLRQPLRLCCAVEGLILRGALTALRPISCCGVRIERSDQPGNKKVTIWRDDELLSVDFYR
jgi:vancomycin resistance protein VanW